MTFYKFLVKKLVFTGEPYKGIYLEYKFTARFVPPIGMAYERGEINFKVVDLHYNGETGRFVIYAQADKELYAVHRNKSGERSFPEIMAEYLEKGWKISKGYEGEYEKGKEEAE